MGLVVDEGLSEDQSDSVIAHAYTECVALNQRELYENGWEGSAVIRKFRNTRLPSYHSCLKHQELMAEVQEHSASLQFDLDGQSLATGIAVR